ncbi:MAG: hypothetical protein K2I37_01610 [Muribaculaceae bacterium]|nr:hypothetical protein [Muribaculaceae bacterium]
MKMNITRLSIIASLMMLFLSINQSAIAAEPARVQVGIDYHYAIGLADDFNGHHTSIADQYFAGGYTTVTCLYNINQKFSAGLGAGIGLYSSGDIFTAPIFGTFRYRPLKNPLKDFYAFTDLGLGLGKEFWNVGPGFLWNIGIGWQKMFRKHFGINFQIAYNLNDFRRYRANVESVEHPDYDYYYIITAVPASDWRHSLAFGVGLVF